MSAPQEIVLIVATAKGGVIGKGNKMPWYLPEDLAHFKALTSGHCIIMGRKTFDSIGKPLPNRRSIVISRNATARRSDITAPEEGRQSSASPVEWADSLESALALSQTLRPKPAPSEAAADTTNMPQNWPITPVFIIGGAQIYAQAMTLAARIELTEIDTVVEGDAWFPAIESSVWKKENSEVENPPEPLLSRTGLSYRFVRLRRT